jgi:hypothetical protein
MCIRKSLLAIAVLGVLATASAYALTNDVNYVTFSGPIALPGVTLPAGTYTFRTPSDMDKNIVQVMNRGETKSYYMGITRPVARPRGRTQLLVTVGEASARQVPPIQAWFPLGQTEGHAFIYDK